MHVIILGCGRSGTSIFGEFFQHLSTYTYYSEPPFEDLKGYDYTQSIAVKVPRESPDCPPTAGLSFPLDMLDAYVPYPRILFWQVRHPLDAICSLKVGISRNWGHHPRPPDWRDWRAKPLVVQCAYHWNYINSIGFEKVADRVHISTFEKLVLNPQVFARWLCQKVEIDVEKEQGAIRQWCQRVQNTNHPHFVEAMTSRPYSTKDHSVRVGRWRENMTMEEYKLVLPLLQETAGRFGYQLTM